MELIEHDYEANILLMSHRLHVLQRTLDEHVLFSALVSQAYGELRGFHFADPFNCGLRSIGDRLREALEICLVASLADVAVDGSVHNHFREAALCCDSIAIHYHGDEPRVRLESQSDVFEDRSLPRPPQPDQG
ncbi:MAG: hypothetical protein JRN11_04520 [Nitrososphaerota archaeon]|nr:hypothetical protein [Nitrososphaerota archaeon]MDG7025990.1 hypothetical protein [Nitrososphaerota archaeon]